MYVSNKKPFFKFNTLSSLINLDTNSYIILSEITAFPFGFLLYFVPPDGFSPKGIDITPMADCGYEVIATIEFPFRFLEMNTFLPGDYRTKEEIEREIKESGFEKAFPRQCSLATSIIKANIQHAISESRNDLINRIS